MIKIIDATLTMLDEYLPTKKQIKQILFLMKEISITDVVISPEIYERLDGELSEEFTFYLEDKNAFVEEELPDVDFCIRHQILKEDSRVIQNVQVNDMLDFNTIAEIPDTQKLLVIGLDDLLLKNDNIINSTLELLKKRDIILYPENTYYSATAIAVEYLQYNSKKGAVISTFMGLGNKAATEQLLLAMHVMKRYKPNMVFDKLVGLRSLYEEITESTVYKHQPIIGKNIFDVESGVHVHGVLKKSTNYEPFPPELVGAERTIVLGKYSGNTSIRYKLEQLGLDGDYDISSILAMVKRLSIKKRREITDEEFREIVAKCNR